MIEWFLISPSCLRLSLLSHSISSHFRPVAFSTVVSASPEGWEEKDFEGDLKKLEKEAEERLDAKIKEMTANIEKTGA